MKIEFDEKRKIFRLMSPEMEYAFAVNAKGQLKNLYWGAPVGSFESYDGIISDNDVMIPNARSCFSSEYCSGDAFDYGVPCIRARFSNGAETLRLHYAGHSITENLLTVTMRDEFYPIEVDLCYKTWDDLPLIGKNAVIRNTGSEHIQLYSAKSASLQLPRGRDFRLTHFAGEWGAEYRKYQTIVNQTRIQIETGYLTDAAAHQVPFFALDEEGKASETMGEVYFGVLQWSGDFQITVEKQHTQFSKQVCVAGGISDFTSQIPLGAGESFSTPLFTVGFSKRGFEHMSEILYDWQLDYELPRGKDCDKAHAVRPVIYNTWYPYEFDIDEEKLIGLIPKAKQIGAELYVIDDGWMKGRVNDKCGLGDWIVDTARFPRGLEYISNEVHKSGMKFGLWVEPEMVNPDSDLYRAHPDWVLSEPNRERSLMRTQCILDMSRDEIRDWAIDWLDRLVIDLKLDYLKWDMNREVSEIGLNSLERGAAVKYMRNIEYIWKHLNVRFPDLLLENCASGGGRADFGMLPYADRVNRSDNADPIDVMLMHEGYSTLFVPKLAGGAGNVSPSPNGINGRTIPLSFRISSGMTGSMSIGINLLKSDEEELEKLKNAVAEFKMLRPALQDSYVYRIASVYENPYCIWQYTRRDRSGFTVFAFGHGMYNWDTQLPRFRMRGLMPDAVYCCGDMKMTGSGLMNIGINIRLKGDYASNVMTWKMR